jgi:K+-sensing histidine kinase KdpD
MMFRILGCVSVVSACMVLAAAYWDSVFTLPLAALSLLLAAITLFSVRSSAMPGLLALAINLTTLFWGMHATTLHGFVAPTLESVRGYVAVVAIPVLLCGLCLARRIRHQRRESASRRSQSSRSMQ